MWKENGTTLSSYVKKKCEENEDGIWQIGNVMFACDDDGNLYFTDSQGNTSVISIADNGEVSIEGGVSADGSIKDDKAPSISATSTTNSITFVAKDILTGVAGWNYSTTNSEPTTWNEVNPAQKSFTHTIENLASNTTYYIWAKDANGNVSSAREINTKDFEEFRYEVSWENATATITVNAPKTGVQFKTSQEGAWGNYSESNKPQVSSGTTVYFQVTDGTNIKVFETVKPVLTYQVRYHANGGNGSMINTVHEYGVEKILSASQYTKEGYFVGGWSTSSDATNIEYKDQSSVINLTNQNNGIVDLYAVWVENNVYLLKNGVDQTLVTGGWETVWTNESYQNGFVEWKSGYLSLGDRSSSYGNPVLFTKNNINVMPYKKLHIEYAVSECVGVQFYIPNASIHMCKGYFRNSNGDIRYSNTFFEGALMNGDVVSRTTKVFDITSTDELGKVVLTNYSHSAGGEKITLDVYNIWLSD